VCSDEAWSRRQWLRQRAALVRMQTALKNRIHALVDQHPVALMSGWAIPNLSG
jgi:hypothetical protein